MVAPGIQGRQSPASRLFTLSLATWRLTALLVYDEGPWGFLEHLRDTVGGPLHCFWCTSVWCAGLLAALSEGSFVTRLVLWMALSGSATLLDELRKFVVSDRIEVI